MRVTIISNPVAGKGRGRQRANALADRLRRRRHQVQVLFTSGRGDARGFAGRLDHDRVDCVVAAGGDGTLNEIVNGLTEPSEIPIAILPAGTANLLARELGLPRDVPGVVSIIESGRVRRLDLGIINDVHRFLLIVSAGFDSMVIEAIDRARGGTLGFLGYPIPIIQVLRRYRRPVMDVQIDDGPEHRAEFVVVSNTRIYAGFFSLTERAVPDSGHLDVCFAPRAGRLKLVGFAWSALRRKFSQRADVVSQTGQVIRIRSRDAPIAIEVDGEHFGQTPVEIQMKPAVVPIMIGDPK